MKAGWGRGLIGASLLTGALVLSACASGSDADTPNATEAMAGARPTSEVAAVRTADSAEGGDDGPRTATPNEVATTTVEATVGTSIDDVIEVEEQELLDELALHEVAKVPGGYLVEVGDLEELVVEARVAGEVSGPAIAVTVHLENESTSALDTSQVTVTATNDAGEPLSHLSGPPSNPFEGRLEPGGSAQAVYVFGLTEGSVHPLTITVTPAPDVPVAVFVGASS